MSAQRTAKSRIFQAVHEGAGDLYRLGFIDKRRLAHYDAICLAPQDDDARESGLQRQRS